MASLLPTTALRSRPQEPANDAKAIRILVFQLGQIGAAAKFTYELLRAMDTHAVSAAVCVAEGSDLHGLAEQLSNVSTHVVSTFAGDRGTAGGRARAVLAALLMPRLARAFARVVRAERPDVIVCTFQSIWDLAVVRTLRRFPGRFILVLHDAAFHPGDSYPFRTSVLRREVGVADALVVLSDHVGRAAQHLYAFPADRITQLQHGAFHFAGARRRPRVHPGHRRLRLLFFGRICRYKGLDLLLAAYRELRAANVEVELEIAGSGDLRPYETALIGLPNVTIRNHWLGEAEIAAALNRADVMVLPYIEASQSGVAAAALDAALPLVATPVGGLVEQVVDGMTGVVATAVTPSAFAAAVQRLVGDPAFYECCSAAARRYADDALGWETIAAGLVDVGRHIRARPPRLAER